MGAAIETIVWSMKVIATAKIIAVRIRLLDWPPVVLLTLMVFLPYQDEAARAQARACTAPEIGALGSH